MQQKKGNYFLPFNERKNILENLSVVSEVIDFEDDEIGSAIEGLKKVKSMYPNDQILFCNGGDRQIDQNNIFEFKVCQELEIPMVDGLGEKIRSSSEYTGLVEYDEPNAHHR